MSDRTQRRLRRVAKFGYAARGFVFLLVAGIATRSAIHGFSRVEGAKEALLLLRPNPVGRLLLAAVAAGLAGYVVWRFVQAAMLPAHEGGAISAQFRRVAFAATGAFYCLLAYTAAELAIGRSPTGDAKRQWTAWLLTVPFGSTLLAVIGVGLTLGGLQTIYRGLFRRFLNVLDTHSMSICALVAARIVGTIGLVSVGLTLAAAGMYAVVAARRSDAGSIRDMGGVLDAFVSGPYAPHLLAIVAVGFGAYAAHCFMLATYRYVPPIET